MVYPNNQYPNFRYCDKLNMEAAEQTKNFLSFIFRLSAGGEGGAGKN